MSEPASISTGIAERYATAIFEIAKENNDLAGLETGINDLAAALGESAELRDLIASPLVSRAEQEGALPRRRQDGSEHPSCATRWV